MNTGNIRVACLFAGGIAMFALTACGSSDPVTAPAPATTSTSTAVAAPDSPPAASSPTTPRTQKPAKPAAKVIGPTGFGKIKLGMSYAEVMATGLVRHDGPPGEGGCAPYRYLDDSAGGGSVFISVDRGVEAIGPFTKVRTPEGVTPGAKVAAVRKIFPVVHPDNVRYLGRDGTRVPGNDAAVYRFGFRDGALADVSLQYHDHKCYE